MGAADPRTEKINPDVQTDIDVEQVKWVVLMVLFSQPGEEAAFARMEDLVFDDNEGAVH